MGPQSSLPLLLPWHAYLLALALALALACHLPVTLHAANQLSAIQYLRQVNLNNVHASRCIKLIRSVTDILTRHPAVQHANKDIDMQWMRHKLFPGRIPANTAYVQLTGC